MSETMTMERTVAETPVAPAASPLLSIEDVSVNFGDFKAIKNVTTSVADHEIRFFIGPNGAGKTTILDAICGKNQVSSGRIVYKGAYDLTKIPDYKISNLGIGRKFQKPTVFEEHRVWENLYIAMAGNKHWLTTLRARLDAAGKARMEQVLAQVRLESEAYQIAGTLSHGQKQRLEIGMLLMQKPRLLLIDEPVAGMTHQEMDRTGELVTTLAGEHSVVVVEHDMAKDRLAPFVERGMDVRFSALAQDPEIP